MRMNKVMKGTALTALAAATWLAAGTTDASAAKAENPIESGSISISINEDQQTMSAFSEDAMEVHVGIGTYNKKGTVKVSEWDVYEYGSENIDLSKLKNTKDSYIAVKTDKSNPVYIKIPAAIKGQKAKYNAGSSLLTIDNIKRDNSSATKPEEYDWEYRTAYSDWQKFYPYEMDETGKWVQSTVFEKFQQQGASLYVRSCASEHYYKDADGNSKSGLELVGTVKDASDKSSDPAEYALYEAGSFPGKESKVSVKKQAKGPAVGIDYAKNTVKLAKDVEVRMIFGYYYAENDSLADVKSGDKVDVEKFFNVTNNLKPEEEDFEYVEEAKAAASAATSGVLEVRKKADEGKGKSASKWTIVNLDKPQQMAIKKPDDKNFDESGEGIVTTSSAVSFAVTNGSISVKYIYKGTGDKAKYSDKVEITNSDSKLDYQVVIKSSEPSSTDKATTVKKGKSAKVTAKKGDTIYIRVAGDKKEKRFAGKYTVVAKTIY